MRGIECQARGRAARLDDYDIASARVVAVHGDALAVRRRLHTPVHAGRARGFGYTACGALLYVDQELASGSAENMAEGIGPRTWPQLMLVDNTPPKERMS